MRKATSAAAPPMKPSISTGVRALAALVALRMAPAVCGYCIFAHRSAERAHGLMLEAMGVEPLLDLGLRLGEGTGALLAVPLVRAASALLCEVASLDDVLARRLIGGRTGDVLGAIEQMFEVGFVLGVAAMAGRDLAEPLLIGLLTI